MTPEQRRVWPNLAELFGRIERAEFARDIPTIRGVDCQRLAQEIAIVVGQSDEAVRDAMRRPPAPIVIEFPEGWTDLGREWLAAGAPRGDAFERWRTGLPAKVTPTISDEEPTALERHRYAERLGVPLHMLDDDLDDR